MTRAWRKRPALLALACTLACGARVEAPSSERAVRSPTPSSPASDGTTDPETTGLQEPGAAEPDRCVDGLLPRRVRRLTAAEYQATLMALFGEAEASLPSDPEQEGFQTSSGHLRVTPLWAEQYASVAETQAARIAAEKTGCDRSCAESTARTWGRRLFRRPLKEHELQRYMDLYAAFRSDGDSVAVETMMTAMLQSPNFVYRTELGRRTAPGRYALTPHEQVTRLAFGLTGAPPDEAALEAAGAAAAGDADALDALAPSLIFGSGVQHFTEFLQVLLRLDRADLVAKDPNTYPEFSHGYRAALVEDFRLQVAQTWSAGASLAALFSAPRPAPEISRTDGEPPRAGILAHPAVLMVHGRPAGSAPIDRGVMVRERILCQHLLPPPPGIVAEPPAVDPTATTRDRYLQHQSDPACANCHERIDPLGFGFEHYDGIGRYRTTENGLSIDASGEVVEGEDASGPFDGAAGLATRLAGSQVLQRCMAIQWARFRDGVVEAEDARCATAELEATDDLTRLMQAGLEDRQRSGPELEPEPVIEMPIFDAGGTQTPQDPDLPNDTPGVTLTVEITDDWGQGYCAAATATNEADAPVTWRASTQIEGTIESGWNHERSGDRGQVQFRGVSWNARLEPEAAASFGFCARR